MIRAANLNQLVPVTCNTGDGEIFANIRSACLRRLPKLGMAAAHEGKAVIVGGGPSMKGLLPMIRAYKNAGHVVFTVNGALKFLEAEGVASDYFVMLDARAENVRFVEGTNAANYLIASQCHPSVFDSLERVTVWHPNFPGVIDIVGEESLVLGGGTTAGLLAISIAYAMGYRQISLFGFDSSYSGTEGHAYAQSLNDGERIEEVTLAGKSYRAAPWMVRQAMEFQGLASQLANDNCVISVHGRGLLPAVAKNMMRDPVTILTVYRSGGQYTPEYVTRLRDGVARNLTIPHRFVCLTDTHIDGVECIALDHDFPGWWAKTEIFRPDLPFKRVFYLDLSTVVTGLLDEMVMQEGRIITSDWYHGGPSQSVLLYDVGDFTNTWETFMANPAYWMAEGDKMIAPNFGDQILMRRTVIPELDYWQDRLPGHLVSYKVHGVPPTARLVKFHGRPKPPEVGWLDTLPLARAS